MSKVWLITGCSRGLGRALAEAVLARGDRLVATARNAKQLDHLAGSHGDRVRAVALDVTDERAAARAVDLSIGAFSRIDVLVNNAGYCSIDAIEDTTLAEFRKQLETNLFGTIIMTKAVIPFMRKQKSGHIIQVSSVGGRVGATGRAAYSAAKWGVEGFSEVLAKEVGPLGIKVTLIEPGGFRTDFAGGSTVIRDGRPEYAGTVGAAAQFQRDYNGKQPGDPAKAARAILHVASLDSPPLRLLLGKDALRIVEQADREKMYGDREWRELSMATDFDPEAAV